MYKHILIATDGSDLAMKGVTQALLFAKKLNSKVSAVTVTEPWTMMVSDEVNANFPIEKYEESCTAFAKKALNAVAAEAKALGMTCQLLHAKNQHPEQGIIKAAEEHGCDLIVMSSHGWRGLKGALLGSQTTNVLTHSKIAVLVIR